MTNPSHNLPLARAALTLLRSAAQSELGLIVRVNAKGDTVAPATRGRQVLWRFRAEDNDPALRALQIRLSPDDPQNEIWIIKFDEELPGHEGYEPTEPTEPARIDIDLGDLDP